MTNEKFCRLLDRLRHNDMSALKSIYEEYFQIIRYTALSITKNADDAYDVATDVIMKLKDYSSNPYAIQNHVGLLKSMTKHEALNFIRKNNHTQSFSDFIEVATASVDNNDLWMQDIFSVLTEEEKEVFLEHCIWGNQLKAICKAKGVSYRTIARIYAEIKDKIKQIHS